jgi:hypothetical protein
LNAKRLNERDSKEGAHNGAKHHKSGKVKPKFMKLGRKISILKISQIFKNIRRDS